VGIFLAGFQLLLTLSPVIPTKEGSLYLLYRYSLIFFRSLLPRDYRKVDYK